MTLSRKIQAVSSIKALSALYAAGQLTPKQCIEATLQRIDAVDRPEVWIYRVAADALYARAAELAALWADAGAAIFERMPLFGVPFAVKDNIDVAGIPTTAGCPEFAYTPAESAFAVQRLLDAGAILIGKTNLDQFATGRAFALWRRAPGRVSGACLGWLEFRFGSGRRSGLRGVFARHGYGRVGPRSGGLQ
jgi:allophanate hydrolase